MSAGASNPWNVGKTNRIVAKWRDERPIKPSPRKVRNEIAIREYGNSVDTSTTSASPGASTDCHVDSNTEEDEEDEEDFTSEITTPSPACDEKGDDEFNGTDRDDDDDDEMQKATTAPVETKNYKMAVMINQTPPATPPLSERKGMARRDSAMRSARSQLLRQRISNSGKSKNNNSVLAQQSNSNLATSSSAKPKTKTYVRGRGSLCVPNSGKTLHESRKVPSSPVSASPFLVRRSSVPAQPSYSLDESTDKMRSLEISGSSKALFSKFARSNITDKSIFHDESPIDKQIESLQPKQLQLNTPEKSSQQITGHMIRRMSSDGDTATSCDDTDLHALTNLDDLEEELQSDSTVEPIDIIAVDAQYELVIHDPFFDVGNVKDELIYLYQTRQLYDFQREFHKKTHSIIYEEMQQFLHSPRKVHRFETATTIERMNLVSHLASSNGLHCRHTGVYDLQLTCYNGFWMSMHRDPNMPLPVVSYQHQPQPVMHTSQSLDPTTPPSTPRSVSPNSSQHNQVALPPMTPALDTINGLLTQVMNAQKRVPLVGKFPSLCLGPLFAPISLTAPNELEMRKGELFKAFIDKHAPLETNEQRTNRDNAVGVLYSIVKNWVRQVGIDSGLPPEIYENAGGTIALSGSFFFHLADETSDIDAVCIAPRFVKRKDFFTSLCEVLQNNPDVSEMLPVPDAFVPLIELKLLDVSIDLLFATIEFDTVPDSIDVEDDKILYGVDTQSLRSLNGPRTTRLVKQLIINYHSFRCTLRCVRYWAKRRSIYSSKLGFLGGVNWTILVAFIGQLFPLAPPSTLLFWFFRIYAQWKWPDEVRLCASYDAGLNFPMWNRTKHRSTTHLMPIITPAYPCVNSSTTVTHSTLSILTEEFRRGALITENMYDSSTDPAATVLRTNVYLTELFKEFNVFDEYKEFIQLEIRADSLNDWIRWSRFVESRIRKLVLLLENVPFIEKVRPLPNCYLSDPDKKSFPRVGSYYIAIHITQTHYKSKEKKKIVKENAETIESTTNYFKATHIQSWKAKNGQVGMDIECKHVNRAKLPNEFSERPKQQRAKHAMIIQQLHQQQQQQFISSGAMPGNFFPIQFPNQIMPSNNYHSQQRRFNNNNNSNYNNNYRKNNNHNKRYSRKKGFQNNQQDYQQQQNRYNNHQSHHQHQRHHQQEEEQQQQQPYQHQRQWSS